MCDLFDLNRDGDEKHEDDENYGDHDGDCEYDEIGHICRKQRHYREQLGKCKLDVIRDVFLFSFPKKQRLKIKAGCDLMPETQKAARRWT